MKTKTQKKTGVILTFFIVDSHPRAACVATN